MANNKKLPAKRPSSNALVKFGNGFKRFFLKIGNAFRNTWHELRKVTWPTREKLVNFSIIVILMIVFLMVVIGLLDTGASSLIQMMMPKA
ncbi:MAG: preprotein translocase subunit SecE [Clostridiales bacterium]|nr:preprotein translocase subunit SecE [Clostridiales bacterium]